MPQDNDTQKDLQAIKKRLDAERAGEQENVDFIHKRRQEHLAKEAEARQRYEERAAALKAKMEKEQQEEQFLREKINQNEQFLREKMNSQTVLDFIKQRKTLERNKEFQEKKAQEKQLLVYQAKVEAEQAKKRAEKDPKNAELKKLAKKAEEAEKKARKDLQQTALVQKNINQQIEQLEAKNKDEAAVAKKALGAQFAKSSESSIDAEPKSAGQRLTQGIQETSKLFQDDGSLQLAIEQAVYDYKANAESELLEQKLSAEKDVARKIAQLEAEGIQVSEDTRAKLIANAEKKLADQRLQDQLSILEQVAGEEEQLTKKQIRLKNAEEKEKQLKLAKLAAAKAKKRAEDNPNDKKAQKEAEAAGKAEAQAQADYAAANKVTLKELFAEAMEGEKVDPDEVKKNNRMLGTALQGLQDTMKGLQAMTDAIGKSLSDFVAVQYKVNTRLQGAQVLNKKGKLDDLNYEYLVDSLESAAFSPLIKAEELYGNMVKLVEEGVASNLEQRSLLMTISDGIAATFEADSDNIRKIIKLQQADSTAARLGMEYYLSSWLNEYVANTEYLQSTFDNVATSLLEASALLSKTSGDLGASAEFEFTVQKWLGALGGVGFSDTTAQNIASALGQLGTGNVEFFSSDIGKLITISAANAGLDIGEIITEGLDNVDTNKLLKSLTEYLQGVADESSNVVKNQLGKTFGVTISDLIAVTNLADLNAVYNEVLSYSDMYGALEESLGGMAERMGIGKLLSNAASNLTYQTAAGIASNPTLYSIWTVTDLISNATKGEGINIPTIGAFGNFLGIGSSVNNLIKLGITGASLLGNIGSMASGLKTVGLFGTSETKLLDLVSIYEGNESIKTRGNGLLKSSSGKRTSSTSTSSSSYVGNESGEDYEESAITSQEDKSSKKKANAKAEAKEEDPVAEYLKDANFVSGFKTIVKKVESIASDSGDILKKLKGTIKVDADIGKISGWFNADTGKWGM